MNKTLKGLLVFVAVALTATGIYLNRWALYDWWHLRDYQAPATVVKLADQTTMTPYARHLFYVYKPQLDDAKAFNHNCRVNQQSIVLGCTVNLDGIYLYNVKDPQLDGIVQVTAAYEMLHVGYSRLSTSEREHVDQMVLDQYNSVKASRPDLVKERQSYLDTEGQGAVANEMHSMMGTEVAQLSPALEEYYSRYFTNRQAILQFKDKYQAAFTSRQKQVQADDKKLAEWQSTIASNQDKLDAQAASIRQERTKLQQLAASDQIDQYNVMVPTFNQKIDSYNSLANQTRSLVKQYNALLAKRNALALEINQLTQTISSQPISNLSGISG